MTTSLSTKLAALALALVFNSVIMGGMAYLFNAQLRQPTAVTSLASTAARSVNDTARAYELKRSCRLPFYSSPTRKHIHREMGPNSYDNQPINRPLSDPIVAPTL